MYTITLNPESRSLSELVFIGSVKVSKASIIAYLIKID